MRRPKKGCRLSLFIFSFHVTLHVMSIAKRKLPIGSQSFKGLREDGFIYVDKTEFIWKLITTSRIRFLSRPRRFGKSIFLSTIAAYFRGQKELFTGLKIADLEARQEKPWQVYPVLYLDFNPSIG